MAEIRKNFNSFLQKIKRFICKKPKVHPLFTIISIIQQVVFSEKLSRNFCKADSNHYFLIEIAIPSPIG